MINISILGLDQFVVGDYSREITKKIADAYEINEDEILFYAPQAFIFHKGFDQSAYNVVVKVEAERKYEVFEKIVFTIISKTLSKYVIHMNIQFVYFDEEHCYSYKNEEYPLYMSESNVVYDGGYEEESDEDVEVYDGNIFENLDELIEEKQREHDEQNNCDCDHHNCDCGHKH